MAKRPHRLRFMVTKVMKAEISIPIIGAKKIKYTVFMILSEATISPNGIYPLTVNACATAAPANPPINVCEEEEGIPYHHVNRFQKIAAMIPAKITSRVI